MVAKDAQSLVPESPSNPPAAGREVPLCVDLDGTLVKTDCLWEAAVRILFRHPSRLIGMILGCYRGRAWIKRQLGLAAPLPAESLPYNEAVISLISQEKSAGRKIILVTASDQLMADAIGAHLKLFDEIIGSDGARNIKGPVKAELLVKRFGRGGYDYAGDSAADIPVWEAARQVYAVNPVPAAKRWVAQRGSAITLGAAGGRWGALARALRPQHWVKNILVFLPLLTAHLWRQDRVWWLLASFFAALCFGASAVYLINDLADLESDRRHKDKWRRPVAAGDLPIANAVMCIPLLLVLAFACCLPQGWKAAELLLGYLAATSAYSFSLKRIPVLDILFLSGFYVFRIVAGAVLAPVELSPWLIAFAMFLFLSLAAAKRYVELTELSETRPANISRGYRREDHPMIAAFGVNCGCLAVLVLGLYVNSDTFRRLYNQNWIFWLLCPLLLYWLIRVWLLAGRRSLHEDPVDFAIKDPVTWIVAALGGLVFIAAMLGHF
ncbi:MAG TPA: UbiA family prenyltransferase [Verrucomicrobiae bacterium]|jgi:4-hydroxybenzoate polyprenyltransferase